MVSGDACSATMLESVMMVLGTSVSRFSGTAGYSLTGAVHTRFPGSRSKPAALRTLAARNK